MATHTITVSATTNTPWPPTLSDGTQTTNTDATNKEFLTVVDKGDTVKWVGEDDVSDIKSIIVYDPDPGAYLLSPSAWDSATESWLAVAADPPEDDLIARYTIKYEVGGIVYEQDPKLQMKR